MLWLEFLQRILQIEINCTQTNQNLLKTLRDYVSDRSQIYHRQLFNQSILKGISPEYSLERLILKLKLQYFGHLMRRATHFKRLWCRERLKAGEGGNRRWDGWRASLTQWTWVWVNSGSWWWTGRPGVLQSMWLQRVGHDLVTELNWPT